jgi:hypothetical protein
VPEGRVNGDISSPAAVEAADRHRCTAQDLCPAAPTSGVAGSCPASASGLLLRGLFRPARLDRTEEPAVPEGYAKMDASCRRGQLRQPIDISVLLKILALPLPQAVWLVLGLLLNTFPTRSALEHDWLDRTEEPTLPEGCMNECISPGGPSVRRLWKSYCLLCQIWRRRAAGVACTRSSGPPPR